MIDWVSAVPELPSWKPETVDAKAMFAKSQPLEVAVWSKDCSIGRIFTVLVVLNTVPMTEY